MSPLQRRLETLEQAHSDAAEFILIVRQIVTPGRPVGEAIVAETGGQKFAREVGETEEAFIERVRAFALSRRRHGQHAAVVVVDDTDAAL